MDKKEDFAEDDLPNFTLEFDFLKEEEEVLAEVLPELVAEQPKKKSRSVDSTEEESNKLLNDSQTKATKYNTKWVVSLFSGKQSHHLLNCKTHTQANLASSNSFYIIINLLQIILKLDNSAN